MSAADVCPGDRVDAVADWAICAPTSAVWQVGHQAPPTALDAATVRTARLEARLAVYAQYAAVLAEEAAAAVGGDEARRSALAAAREDAAEHFVELRDALPSASEPLAFADALTDALHELRHHDAVDEALAAQLRALREASAIREFMPALAGGGAPAPRLDLRF